MSIQNIQRVRVLTLISVKTHLKEMAATHYRVTLLKYIGQKIVEICFANTIQLKEITFDSHHECKLTTDQSKYSPITYQWKQISTRFIAATINIKDLLLVDHQCCKEKEGTKNQDYRRDTCICEANDNLRRIFKISGISKIIESIQRKHLLQAFELDIPNRSTTVQQCKHYLIPAGSETSFYEADGESSIDSMHQPLK